MIKRLIVTLLLCANLTLAQDNDNQFLYYGAIAGFYGLAELLPDHDPWMSSDTVKQQFEANNTVPTPYLIGINFAAFSLAQATITSNNFSRDPRGYNNFAGHIEALIAQHGVTTFVKKLVRRERPNKGKDKVSFWSGHASTSFTTATYLTNYVNDYSNISTGAKWTVGILSFSFASYVAWTRVDDRQHHTSDVIVGAIWGILASQYIYNIRNNGTHNVFSKKVKKKSKVIGINLNFNL